MSHEAFIDKYIRSLFAELILDSKSVDEALNICRIMHEGEISDERLRQVYTEVAADPNSYLDAGEQGEDHHSESAYNPTNHVMSSPESKVPPVEFAIMAGDLRLAQERIDAGADLEEVTKRGTAMETAISRCNHAAIALLRKNGARFEPKTIAERHSSHRNIAKMLCEHFPDDFEASHFAILSSKPVEDDWWRRYGAPPECLSFCSELSEVTNYFGFDAKPEERDARRIAASLSSLEGDAICNLATKNLMMVAMLAERDGISPSTAAEHEFYAMLIKRYVIDVLGETLDEAPGARDYIQAVERMLTKYV